MTLSNQNLSFELPIRKPMKKPTIDDTIICHNKSTTKTQKKKNKEKIKVNPDRYEINHFIIKENSYMGKKRCKG